MDSGGKSSDDAPEGFRGADFLDIELFTDVTDTTPPILDDLTLSSTTIDSLPYVLRIDLDVADPSG